MRRYWTPVLVLSAGLLLAVLALAGPASAATAPDPLWQKALGGTSYEYANDLEMTADGGYIAVGTAQSTNGDVAGNHGAYDVWVVKLDAAGSMLWQKCLGGTYYDEGEAVEQTTDGGYIVAGYTWSTDGDVLGNHGNHDAWVVKLDAAGNLVWQRCLGGSARDDAYDVQQTGDGGYMVAGQTFSTDGGVLGNHGAGDAWVVRLDAAGNPVWQGCFGGSGADCASALQRTGDGGYIMTVYAASTDGDVSGNHGGNDVWVVKLDAWGGIVWKKCLGGSDTDFGRDIRQTADGGYIVAASTYSSDGDVTGHDYHFDAWIVKLDAAGGLTWQTCLGGSGRDEAWSVEQTADGGYVVTGSTESTDGDVTGQHGVADVWVAKLGASGGLLWQRCLGGSWEDGAFAVHQTADAGYVVAGSAASNDGDVTGNHGSPGTTDLWVVRLGPEPHALQWQGCYGGTSVDQAFAVGRTTDGGSIVAGAAYSTDGDVTGNHGTFGNADVWVLKLNAAGALQWQKCLGGTGFELANAVQQTSDGGYVVAGATSSTNGDITGMHAGYGYDLWILKLDPVGTLLWKKCLGGTGSEYATAVQQTVDGGYVVAGYTDSTDGDVPGNHGEKDAWVVRLDAAGTLLWQRCLGGAGDEWAYSVQQTADGGYVASGRTFGSDGAFAGGHGGWYEAWVATLDAGGNVVWTKGLGGTGAEQATAVQQTGDGGYIVAGNTDSTDGDVSGNHGGTSDAWVVKLTSAGALSWQRCLGGSGEDTANGVEQTADGGYVLAGWTDSADGDVSGSHGAYDVWVVKLDAGGNLKWQECLGGTKQDDAYALDLAADGGVFVAGVTDSNDGDVSGNHGGDDIWVVKLTAEAAPPVLKFPGGSGLPRDTNADGKYDDVNGNGRKDFADVVLYFNQMSWIAANEPMAGFDYNGNGRIDFADVVWLFNHL